MVIAHDVTLRTLSDRAVRGHEQRLRGTVVRPGDVGYEQARRVWNPAIDRYPALVACPRCAADVFHAVDFARANDLTLAVRGGGHSLDGHGTVDSGLVVDLSNMKRLVIDPMRRMAWEEPGLTWGDYLACTDRYRLATPSGDARSVGLGGLTLGGGMGWLTRKYGLTIANLLAVDVVTADGRRLQASDYEHSDLFWALRGGGGNFGVATGFRFRLQPAAGSSAGQSSTLPPPRCCATTSTRLPRRRTSYRRSPSSCKRRVSPRAPPPPGGGVSTGGGSLPYHPRRHPRHAGRLHHRLLCGRSHARRASDGSPPHAGRHSSQRRHDRADAVRRHV